MIIVMHSEVCITFLLEHEASILSRALQHM